VRLRRLAATGLLVAGFALFARSAVAEMDTKEQPRRDEFGLVPEDAADKELILPDPVLDRTWPLTKPGDPRRVPEKIAPEEGSDDPFEDKSAPPPPPPRPAPRPDPDAKPDDDEKPTSQPAPPPVAPDGRRDAGSPVPEHDPDVPDLLERDPLSDPTDIEEEEGQPSPLDQDDQQFDSEFSDPGE